MSLALNKPKLDNLAGDIWKSAERLRGKFKAYEYQSVILPIIVIRRLECVLLAWRVAKSAEVLAKRPNLGEIAKDELYVWLQEACGIYLLSRLPKLSRPCYLCPELDAWIETKRGQA